MDTFSTVPHDVRLARAIRALRDAVLACGAACLGLAVVAGAILALSASHPVVTGRALTVLGGGQLLALVGAVLGAVGLRGALIGRPVERELAMTHERLGWVGRATLVWSIGAAVAWIVADPATVVLTLALAAVTAQLLAVLAVVRRRLARAG